MKKSTLFCDIDGTLLIYRKFSTYKNNQSVPIKETIYNINVAFDKGHHIILTTARPEYLRYHTMEELSDADIQFHTLIMGIARGPRLLINDNEKDSINRAFAINVKRNHTFTKEQSKLFNTIIS
tara:strand:- start:2772 stop:3143 length:372 start_codon:yes stop_codon:yes gene_type:complete